jgi:thioredoxin 1
MITYAGNLDLKKAILYFSASWCQPCKFLKPMMHAISEERKDIDIYYVDVDENSQLAQEYKVMGVPMLIMFNQGEQVSTVVGSKPKHQLYELIRTHFPDNVVV